MSDLGIAVPDERSLDKLRRKTIYRRPASPRLRYPRQQFCTVRSLKAQMNHLYVAADPSPPDKRPGTGHW